MNALKDDLLSGVKEISDFVGEDQQVTGRLIRQGLLPAFKRGRKIFARRSEINAAFRSDAA
ncbi:helix-turn-helix domain-containing protein [Sphingopyxis witflariensis]|uniref:helix-turn-helix domain-containing protein n=1 Tax=Sphingopyxis witflariensis TaxID=173675 RepID=UPI000B4E2287|nr:helix-turn-helix domain-containing protein [Sphingopyxis witflariensis]